MSKLPDFKIINIPREIYDKAVKESKDVVEFFYKLGLIGKDKDKK